MLALLRRLGVPEAEVDDVAQDVFLTIHEKLPEFEGRSSLKTWICGISLRKAAAQRRTAARRRARVEPLSFEPGVSCVPEELIAARERAALFDEALADLPDAQRVVFVLYEVEELSMVEVAGAVGCPRFTAYTRLHAARRRMRAFFERAHAAGRLR